MGTKKVFLFSGGGNTQPLWARLSEHVPIAFLLPQAEQVARSLGIENIVSLQTLFTPEVQEKAVNGAALLTARIVANLPTVSNRIGQAYYRLPESLNGNLGQWFAGFVAERIRNQVVTLAVLEKLSEEYEIVGCLTHEDVTPDMRGLVNFCNTINVPTIHLPHAACHLLPGVEDIHRQARARWILSSGKYMTGFYLDCGVPEHKIIEVGIPEWDSLAGANMPDKTEARRILGIDSEFVILYATTWGQTTSIRSRFEVEFQETHEAVFRMAKERDASLIISLHPGEPQQAEEGYANLMRGAGVHGLVSRAHKVYVIRAADVIISHGPSNFCVQTSMMGRPSCYIQTEGFDYDHILPPRGPVSEIGELVDAALAARPEAWQNFIGYYDCAWPDASATDKALEAIGEICNLPLRLTAGE